MDADMTDPEGGKAWRHVMEGEERIDRSAG
jgi:hypothetical protein